MTARTHNEARWRPQQAAPPSHSRSTDQLSSAWKECYDIGHNYMIYWQIRFTCRLPCQPCHGSEQRQRQWQGHGRSETEPCVIIRPNMQLLSRQELFSWKCRLAQRGFELNFTWCDWNQMSNLPGRNLSGILNIVLWFDFLFWLLGEPAAIQNSTQDVKASHNQDPEKKPVLRSRRAWI